MMTLYHFIFVLTHAVFFCERTFISEHMYFSIMQW